MVGGWLFINEDGEYLRYDMYGFLLSLIEFIGKLVFIVYDIGVEDWGEYWEEEDEGFGDEEGEKGVGEEGEGGGVRNEDVEDYDEDVEDEDGVVWCVFDMGVVGG